MTEDSGKPAPGAAAGPTATAAEFLAPALLALSEAVGVASRRVVAAGGTRRAAAGAEPDVEAVHDFRVALRRLRTLLRPARRVYGKKRLQKVSDDLRLYANATGALRDEEVLRETLSALPLHGEVRATVDAWIQRRSRKERACRAEVIRLLSGGSAHGRGGDATVVSFRLGAARSREVVPTSPSSELEPCLARLEARLARPKHRRRGAEDLARAALEEALAGVRALAAGDPADGPAMHTLRIRWKRLRYSAETFSPLLGERAARTAKSAARMQRRLGQLHDVDEATLRMTRAWGLSPADRAAVLAALATERARIASKVATELGPELAALAAEWPPSTPPVA